MAAKYFDIHSTSSAHLLLRLRKRGMIYSRERWMNVSEWRETLECERVWATEVLMYSP